jgi:muramoyltetrapeptide carboxypeptidase
MRNQKSMLLETSPMSIQAMTDSTPILWPPHLKAGDEVRFVSPASTPDKEDVLRRARVIEAWGLKVDFGEHAFKKLSYLAGTDEERLSDLNSALRDPKIRAVFTTRGGKGSYRIADGIDFGAVCRDPKFLIGFSDITILHLSLWKNCRLIGVHGNLYTAAGPIGPENEEALRHVLMTTAPIIIQAREDEPTSALTTTGKAAGRLIGGNLEMIATAAGWALPRLDGAILLIEDINKWPGAIDRPLTMLRKAGHLDGLAGIAVGQFTNFEFDVVGLLREHLERLDVPILGGLPLGHGAEPHSVPIGAVVTLDTSSGNLTVAIGT